MSTLHIGLEDDHTFALRKSPIETLKPDCTMPDRPAAAPPLSVLSAVLSSAAAPSADSSAMARGEVTPGSRLLNYELGERIGAGGMGMVYRATHTWLGRSVAIKFISPDLLQNTELRERFHYEARAVGSLDHPHVVRATDAGQVGGLHYLVTEFIEGRNLMDLVRDGGPLHCADACEIVRQAALGLQHAHEHKMVHRDVKPSNLLLSRAGVVKLVDFGLARMADGYATMTTTGRMLGTLDYLAPEQAHDARCVDIRADIYSLGCTLYFLLCGRPPFGGLEYDTPASKIKGHLMDQPAPPATYAETIPPGVLRCLERMMAKQPSDRFGVPSEVVAALEPHCRGADPVALAASELVCGGRKRTDVPTLGAQVCSGLLAVLLWPLTFLGGMFRRRPNYGVFGPSPRREPSISWGGLLAIFVLGFFIVQFSCVPIQFVEEDLPPGLHGEPGVEVFELGVGGPPPIFAQPNRPTTGAGRPITNTTRSARGATGK